MDVAHVCFWWMYASALEGAKRAIILTNMINTINVNDPKPSTDERK